MAELIDRRDIVFAHKVEGSEEYKEGFLDGAMCVLDAIDEMPTIDAKPVVHAHWKRKNNETKCSDCKFIYYSNHDDFNYCPNRGATMDGKENKNG